MDNFILKNNEWLKNLPLIMYTLVVIIIVIMIVIVFLVYKKMMNKSLKSQKNKSAFAEAYSECMVDSSVSSAPLKRNDDIESDIHLTRMSQTAPVPERPRPALQAQNRQESVKSAPAPVPPADRSYLNDPRILDFYFEFEDEYKI